MIETVVNELKKYRGIRIRSVRSEGDFEIVFRCLHKRSLAQIAAVCGETTFLWVDPDPTRTKINFTLYFTEEDVDRVVKLLDRGIKDNPRVSRDYVLRN